MEETVPRPTPSAAGKRLLHPIHDYFFGNRVFFNKANVASSMS